MSSLIIAAAAAILKTRRPPRRWCSFSEQQLSQSIKGIGQFQRMTILVLILTKMLQIHRSKDGNPFGHPGHDKKEHVLLLLLMCAKTLSCLSRLQKESRHYIRRETPTKKQATRSLLLLSTRGREWAMKKPLHHTHQVCVNVFVAFRWLADVRFIFLTSQRFAVFFGKATYTRYR